MLSRKALSSCRTVSFQQHFCRSLATEVPPPTAESPLASSSSQILATRPKKAGKARITTAVILNRAPIITRTPTTFERAYYAYQARIRRAMHNPFPLEFYFKQGSLLETRFVLEEQKRERKAFGPSFGKAEKVSAEKAAVDKAAAEQLAQQEGEGEELMPRVHKSDGERLLTSLDRKGKRNLYLLLRAEENGELVWRFPQGDVEKGELLHQAAQRDLHLECGAHMDTWIVSRNPIGVYKPALPNTPPTAPEDVTFFFKAHILAGQVKPQGDIIKEFAWLTKQEIETRVDKDYWNGTKDILSDF